MSDFAPRLRPAVYPSRRRAVMWQGRLMRPSSALDVIMWGRPPIGPVVKRRPLFHVKQEARA